MFFFGKSSSYSVICVLGLLKETSQRKDRFAITSSHLLDLQWIFVDTQVKTKDILACVQTLLLRRRNREKRNFSFSLDFSCAVVKSAGRLRIYRVSQKNCVPFVSMLWRSCRFNHLGFYTVA